MNSYTRQAEKLRERFLGREYPDEVLRDAYKKEAWYPNKDNLLVPRNRDQQEVIRVISTFNDGPRDQEYFIKALAYSQNGQRHWYTYSQ